MKPLLVRQIRTIIAGNLIQGSDDAVVHYGAYRLKQIKHPNTVFFSKKVIFNWEKLHPYFPLILVTEQAFSPNDQLSNLIVIKVNNVEEAFWKFVKYYRSLFQIPVIAITGTSGKTTTKEMIRHILSFDKNITATNSTNNSRTAHLQYLLSIDEKTEAAVIETAVGAPGDIIKAGEYFKPTIGMITNIGEHHLNYCRTPEIYLKTKAEMVDILDNSSVLIINSEDENTKKIDLRRFRGKIIVVGQSASCHFRASNIKYSQNGMKFDVEFEKKTYSMFIPGFGTHQVYNALFAIAAVSEIGLDLKEIANRLKTFQNLNKHLQLYDGINSSTILDDTWSMTTTSLEAALKVLNEIGKGKKKIAIVGTITDVGAWGQFIHEQAGKLIYEQDVNVLITIGYHARIMAQHAKKLGSKSETYVFNNSIRVYDLIKKIADKNTIILIKGDMYSKPIFELAAKLREVK
ncbi:UDP-N-acetylmuramoyl-tripeptide--D-alanyl-D-alanine ligase [Bacillus sp. Bva_UNVM-123]|uniref:Mur ligase family protein n=1 Tax=Bacillus sp. Bva_UNVM-123 TaxID=2829798 RepID=UPI00391F6C31